MASNKRELNAQYHEGMWFYEGAPGSSDKAFVAMFEDDVFNVYRVEGGVREELPRMTVTEDNARNFMYRNEYTNQCNNEQKIFFIL